MHIRATRLFIFFFLGMAAQLFAADAAKDTPPRFPSYVKPPKTIEDIMPFAGAAVRQTGGRMPLGLVEKGTLIALVTERLADDRVLQAIVRAYKERGVEARVLPEHELAGVNREEALKAIRANNWYTSELGFTEIRPWIMQRFADPEVPKKWLRERPSRHLQADRGGRFPASSNGLMPEVTNISIHRSSGEVGPFKI